jgi:hypothetical protein
MSSATSIEPAAPPAPGDARPRDVFRPWHFFVLASLITATAAVVMARQARPEHLVLISLTIGAAGFAGAALYRTLHPLASTDVVAPVARLTEGTRAVLEREKHLALRAIKELEFDRAMGKVSAKDFDEMSGRLRARALSIMKQLDAEGGYRELIERELKARLTTAATAQRAAPQLEQTGATSRAGTCACGTANDADASFCKRCGSRLARTA